MLEGLDPDPHDQWIADGFALLSAGTAGCVPAELSGLFEWRVSVREGGRGRSDRSACTGVALDLRIVVGHEIGVRSVVRRALRGVRGEFLGRAEGHVRPS